MAQKTPLANPTRVEHVIWSRAELTPAAKAFLALLDIHADDTGSHE
ncbi:hypothetical protein ACWD8I_28480 [Micromonospora arida]